MVMMKTLQWFGELSSKPAKVTLPKLSFCEDPMPAEIYAVKTTPQPGTYAFTKFDNDLNPLRAYLVSQGECNCPRGETGKRCRHQEMLPVFLKAKHINDGWYFNHSTRQWVEPTTDAQAIIDERDLPKDPPPEPQVLASAPQPPALNGGGSTPAFGKSFKRRI